MSKVEKLKRLGTLIDKFLTSDPWFVASNINSPTSKLKKLARHKNSRIRRAIATNPSSTSAILVTLLKDVDTTAREDAATRLMDQMNRHVLILPDKHLMNVIYVFHTENFEAVAKFKEIRKREQKTKKAKL